MLFPQNPKILVVDDTYNDVELLLESFLKKGIPHVYYGAKKDSEFAPPVYTFPEEPLLGVRFVILDIELEGVTDLGTGDKNIAQLLINHLRKLMNLKESSYAILFWTKRKEVIDSVLYYLKLEKEEPIACIDMEKPAASDLTLDYIQEKFFSDLNNESFDFLINWENSINQYTSNFTNELSNIVKQESENSKQEWKASMKTILSKMACTYTGKNDISDLTMDQANSYAVRLLNQSFSESMSTSLQPSLPLPVQSKVSLQVIADLNKILFVEASKDDQIETGKVFVEENNRHLHYLLESSIIKKTLIDNCKSKLIGVVLTPNCDIAHGNMLTDSLGNESHRILFGLKILVSDDPAKYVKKKKDYLYITHPFNDENKSCSAFIFHFGTIQTVSIKPSSIHFSYFMKNSLAFDLQSKLANHVNRLGNSMFEC